MRLMRLKEDSLQLGQGLRAGMGSTEPMSEVSLPPHSIASLRSDVP